MTDANGPNGQRDQRGRWLPGNRGGPGSAKARLLHRHHTALAEAITPEELVGVMRSLLVAAQRGSVPAAQVLLERVAGKPRSPLPAALRASSPVEAARAALAAAARGEADGAEALAFVRGCLDVGEHEQLVNLEERLRELEARP